MEIKQLNPAEVVRDETGSWIHPEFLNYLNSLESESDFFTNEEWAELKRHFNIETVTLWMESSVSNDDWESMMDDCDITKWDPIAPHFLNGVCRHEQSVQNHHLHHIFLNGVCRHEQHF